MQPLNTLLTIALLCLAISGTASASFERDNQSRIVVAQSGGLSLSEAVEQVRRQYNGRIVSAETKISGHREVHHIKVLTSDGKVKTVRIPGRSRRS